MLYFLVAPTLLAISALGQGRLAKVALLLSATILFVTFGGKYYNGWDWIVYEAYFSCMSAGWSLESDAVCAQFGNFPPFFVLVVRFAKFMSDDVQALYLISAATTVSFLSFSVYRYSRNPALSLFVFFCLFGWALGIQAIRQAIAVGIFIWSVRYIIDQQLLKYSVCIIAASLFHPSALGLWPLYFLLRSDLSLKSLAAGSIMLAGLILLFRITAGGEIDDAVILSGDQLLAYESNKILGYLKDERLSGAISLGALGKWLAQVPIAWYLAMKRPATLGRSNRSDEVFIKLYLIYFALYLPLGQISFLSRFLLYFGIATIFIIPLMVDELRNQFLAKLSVVGFCLLILISPLRDNFQRIDYLPFNNYFLDKVLMGRDLTYENELERLLSEPCFVSPQYCDVD